MASKPRPFSALNVSRNCGLFRYWTLSNLPLFLLAAPMLTIMAISGMWALSYPAHPLSREKQPPSTPIAADTFILRNLAISQLVLALLTLTTAHVQIITRISSASPVWVWALAMASGAGTSPWTKNAVRFMVMYSIIQAGLFASFLPPA